MSIEFKNYKNTHLAKYLFKRAGRYTIDFKDPKAVRELTYAILLVDYNIKLEIPLNSLCPPIPNRIQYLDYLADSFSVDFKVPTHCIDVGTGASCIYPLLGYHKYNWEFLASEINPSSVEYAIANVTRNHALNHIEVVKTDASYIIPIEFMKKDREYQFVICNPPFYESYEDISKSRGIKSTDPFSVCKGSENEMITPGGEIAFIKQMFKESQSEECKKVQWFTCLLGKKCDYEEMNRYLMNESGIEIKGDALRQGRTCRKYVEQCSTKVQELVNGYPSVINIDVKWGEQDAFGHLNNVVYFRYAETSRIAFMEQVIKPNVSRDFFNGFLNAKGVGVIIKSLQMNYKSPVVYPDVITMGCRIKNDSIENDRFTQEYVAISHQQQRIVANGEAVVVLFDYAKNAKAKIPEEILACLLGSINSKSKI